MLCMSDFLCIIKKLEGILHFLKKNKKKQKSTIFQPKIFQKSLSC